MGLVRRILGQQKAYPSPEPIISLPASIMSSSTWTNGIPVVDPGVPLESLTEINVAGIWRTQPNVRKVVDFIARSVASIPIKAYERISDTDRRRLEGHPLVDLLAQPQARTIPYRFWHAIVSDGLLYDRWACLKVIDGDGLRLVRIPAWRVTFEVDYLGQVTAVKAFTGTDGQWHTFAPDDVVYDHGYAPKGEAGLSPLHTLADILAESAEAVRYRRQVWKNGARVPAWIGRGVPPEVPEWGPAERNRFLAEFDATYTGDGPRAGGVPLIEDGMQLHETKAFTPQDTQDLEGRRLTAIEVAAAYHVAPELVGAQQGNYSNVREYRQMLYRDSLGPYIIALEQVLNLMVVPDLAQGRPLYVEANVDAKLRGSFEERAQIVSTSTGAPWLTRNEARAMDNRPPVDGGDELVVPLNVLVGGQASPRDAGSQNTGPKAVRVKALDPVLQRLRDEYADDVKTFLSRQSAAVTSALGAKALPPLADAWDTDRWDRELAAIVFQRMKRAADIGADEVLAQMGGDFDRDAMLGWLSQAAKNTARDWNAKTYDDLSEAVKDPDWKSTVANVFAVAVSQRASYLAETTSTDAGNFGRTEVAKTSGLTVKTWRVTSGNPRSSHAAMDGETVAVGEAFSNGARWPGDSVLPEEERANCRCEVEFRRDEP